VASERRRKKINQLLREEIAEILDREIEFPEKTLVTVTRAEISPDGYYAAIYISVLGDSPEKTLEILASNVYHIQQLLNRRIRMRPVPKIRFAVDEEEKRREIVEKSISELKRKKEL